MQEIELCFVLSIDLVNIPKIVTTQSQIYSFLVYANMLIKTFFLTRLT